MWRETTTAGYRVRSKRIFARFAISSALPHDHRLGSKALRSTRPMEVEGRSGSFDGTAAVPDGRMRRCTLLIEGGFSRVLSCGTFLVANESTADGTTTVRQPGHRETGPAVSAGRSARLKADRAPRSHGSCSIEVTTMGEIAGSEPSTLLQAAPLRVGISTRALFDLEEEHGVFHIRGCEVVRASPARARSRAAS